MTDVIFEEKRGEAGDVGVITLNRPQVLNCLNDDMVRAIDAHLRTWQQAPHIKAILIRAVSGRAFCAGGDIRLSYELARKKDQRLLQFFNDEFAMNQRLFHLSKPYISFLDGITMGGGAGVSIHGSHRVATERMVFAMPETAIGFFPDIGATYFLPRLPGKMGWYLGLTGDTIGADDTVRLGLAQHKVPSAQLEALFNTILQTNLGLQAKARVTELIASFAKQPAFTPLQAAQTEIEACFSHPTIESIIASLQKSPNDICRQAAHTLLQRSPTSLKVTLRALNQGQRLDFDRCLEQAAVIAKHFLLSHDFCEGIRAAIIDKDHTPDWQPKTLAEVSQAAVAAYFN